MGECHLHSCNMTHRLLQPEDRSCMLQGLCIRKERARAIVNACIRVVVARSKVGAAVRRRTRIASVEAHHVKHFCLSRADVPTVKSPKRVGNTASRIDKIVLSIRPVDAVFWNEPLVVGVTKTVQIVHVGTSRNGGCVLPNAIAICVRHFNGTNLPARKSFPKQRPIDSPDLGWSRSLEM